jgi:hypothetical protein
MDWEEGELASLVSATAYGVQGLSSLLFYFCMAQVEAASRGPLTLLIAIPGILLAVLFVVDLFSGLLETHTVGKVFRGLAYLVIVAPQLFAVMSLFVALNPGIAQPFTDRVVGLLLGGVISGANLIGGAALKEKAGRGA